MRGVILAVVMFATPAAATGIPDAPRWSLDVHDIGKTRSLDAVLQARRIEAG
jgi:hypothetical protein